MNDEFSLGNSVATDSTFAMYPYKYNIYINITSTRMHFYLSCSRKRSYLNPLNTPFLHSLVLSFTRSFLLYTLEASFSPRKESVHNCCSNVPNAELLITFRPIYLLNEKKKRMNKEASLYKRPEFSIAYELSPLNNFLFFGEGPLWIRRCSTRY